MIKFEKNCIIKPKVYLSDCKISGNYWRLIIVITHNKYIFSINDRVQKT